MTMHYEIHFGFELPFWLAVFSSGMAAQFAATF